MKEFMKILFYLGFFFFGCQLVLLWIFWQPFLIYIWIVNIVLLFSFWLYERSLFPVVGNAIYKRFHGIVGDDVKNWSSEFLSNQQNVFTSYFKDTVRFLYDLNKHFIFVFSLLVFILAIINYFLFPLFADLSLLASFLIFLFSFLVNSKFIFAGEVYLGNRRLVLKDFLFMFSMILVFLVINAMSLFPLSIKSFVSLLAWGLFYSFSFSIFAIQGEKKFYKHFSVQLYVILIAMAFVPFIITYFPQIKNYFVVEKIVYIESTSTSESLQTTGWTSFSGVEWVAVNSPFSNFLTTTWNLNYIDILDYLFMSQNVKLSTSTGVVFENIPENSQLYPLFKTAVDLSLVNTAVRPTDPISCNQYIVYLWVIEKWPTGTGDIYVDHWNQAVASGRIPANCTKEKMLVVWDL